MPFAEVSNFGGMMYKYPSLSASKSSLGSTFDGGDCRAAGPLIAIPVIGSYVLA